MVLDLALLGFWASGVRGALDVSGSGAWASGLMVSGLGSNGCSEELCWMSFGFLGHGWLVGLVCLME